MSWHREAQFQSVGPWLVFVCFLEPNCFALLPPTYNGLSFLNDRVFKRRTSDIWVGSAKHNSNLWVPGWSSSASSASWTQLLRSLTTNCWVRKSACLYNNCQYSGVGSDWGRGDLPNVIFNSLDILHVFVQFSSSERVQPSFHYFHRVVPLTTLIVRTTGG